MDADFEVDTDGEAEVDADGDGDTDMDGDTDADEDTDDGGLTAGFEEDLTHTVGCADVVIAAYNTANTMALFFRASGVAAAAHDAGEPTTFDYDLPLEGVTVEVQLGVFLTTVTCNDAIVPGEEPVVEARYHPIEGTARILVTPTGEPTPWGEVPARVDLTLQDVVFEREGGGDRVALDSFELADIYVGWMPG